MERNDSILFLIFENFLSSNLRELYAKNERDWNFDTIRKYCTKDVSDVDQSLLNWHLVLFVSEFIVDRRFMNSFLESLNPRIGDPATIKYRTPAPTDYLTRSGQLFYKELKRKNAEKE